MYALSSGPPVGDYQATVTLYADGGTRAGDPADRDVHLRRGVRTGPLMATGACRPHHRVAPRSVRRRSARRAQEPIALGRDFACWSPGRRCSRGRLRTTRRRSANWSRAPPSAGAAPSTVPRAAAATTLRRWRRSSRSARPALAGRWSPPRPRLGALATPSPTLAGRFASLRSGPPPARPPQGIIVRRAAPALWCILTSSLPRVAGRASCGGLRVRQSPLARLVRLSGVGGRSSRRGEGRRLTGRARGRSLLPRAPLAARLAGRSRHCSWAGCGSRRSISTAQTTGASAQERRAAPGLRRLPAPGRGGRPSARTPGRVTARSGVSFPRQRAVSRTRGSGFEHLVEEGLIGGILGRLQSGKRRKCAIVRFGENVVAAKVCGTARRTLQEPLSPTWRGAPSGTHALTQRAMDRRLASTGKGGRGRSVESPPRPSAPLQTPRRRGARAPTPVLFLEGVLLMESSSTPTASRRSRIIDATSPSPTRTPPTTAWWLGSCASSH